MKVLPNLTRGRLVAVTKKLPESSHFESWTQMKRYTAVPLPFSFHFVKVLRQLIGALQRRLRCWISDSDQSRPIVMTPAEPGPALQHLR